jgi:hypothetical protein
MENFAPTILDTIPFKVDLDNLVNRLRVKKRPSYIKDVERLYDTAQTIGRPKAYYRPATVNAKGDDYVIVDGERFTSRILRTNLEQVDRVFVYVVTSGQEMEAWTTSLDDLLLRFWAETINEMTLRTAVEYTRTHMAQQYGLAHTAQMNPGALPEWPLTEQKPLFKILGDVESALGVRLTESLLMLPRKTLSGFEFATEANFVSCQLCLRERCPGRRAAYDPAAYAKYYPGADPEAAQLTYFSA